MAGKSRQAYTRRQFITQSSLTGLALANPWVTKAFPLANGDGSRSPAASAETELTSLRNAFLSPLPSARPLTRWWWFGVAITPEEITRELTLMRDGGLRGVELQPLYPIAVDDPSRGIRNIRYFTSEWYALLRHTVKEAQRLGLQLDFTLGSGWPYGGPFIPIELAARRLRVLSQSLVGPREFSWDLAPHLTEDEKIIAAVAAPVLSTGQLDLQNANVITDRTRKSIDDRLMTSLGIERWQVPPGNWTVMVFVDSPTGQQVKRPALGMEGNVLDHFSREAMDLFLRAAGDRTLDELKAVGRPPFHSIFCDSLEVYGADWTPDFLQQFQRRRGYQLAAYLPALWQDAGPLTPHVRYDYHLTLSELILDNFFRPLAEWSEAHGMQARVQAHGAMGDVMRGYGLAHIPEGESIMGGDRYRVNLRHRRLASSAGHIYQKPLVSAETYTWLRLPLFLVTLEMMKAATDVQFLDGINHIVNQGYSASPPQAGQPGWVFYAATMINHNNTWWRHYPHLARYIQRASTVLREGVSVNPVAVYLPLADVYAKFGTGGLSMDVELENRLGTELCQELRRAGYDFDLINDHALASVAKVEGGKLRAGTAEYAAVIVSRARYMPPESLERLAEFAEGGGLLIFHERFPEAAPGVMGQAERTARLQAILTKRLGNGKLTPGEPVPVGRGAIGFAANPTETIRQLRVRLNPDFEILEAGDNTEASLREARENVGFVHRRAGSGECYFVSNVSADGQELRVRFNAGHRRPERWNPETGEVEASLVYQHVKVPVLEQPATEVQLRLEPFEACFVVFSPSRDNPAVTRTNWWSPLQIEMDRNQTRVSGPVVKNADYWLESPRGKRHRFTVQGLPAPLDIKGPWTLKLGESAAVSLPALVSWNDLPEGKAYSGWAGYETTFDMPQLAEGIEWVLDLGSVHETAEVTLNGVALGSAWKAPRRLACGSALKAGQNSLKVDVANLWIHKVRSLPPPDLKALAETYGIRWGRYGEVPPKEMPPSGLLGPVRLLPQKRWMIRF